MLLSVIPRTSWQSKKLGKLSGAEIEIFWDNWVSSIAADALTSISQSYIDQAIGLAGWIGPCSPWGKISTTFTNAMLRNAWKCLCFNIFIANKVTFQQNGPQNLALYHTLYVKVHLNSLVRVHWNSGPWFNIKMSSYQYRESHYRDKTILRPSYLHNEIPYTGKMTSLYWINPLVTLCIHSDHFVYVPSQWETTLQCNVVSHWLGACTKWSL